MRHLIAGLCCTTVLIGACSKPAPAPPVQTTSPTPATPSAQTAPTPAALTEKAKIEKLLEALAASPDTFARNGSDYTGKQAADHLRSKWSSAGDRVKTARDFIDGLASKSSMSGKPYTVKRADGATVTAGEWFNQQLKLIEEDSAPHAPVTPAPAATPAPKVQGFTPPTKEAVLAASQKPTFSDVLDTIKNAPETFVIVESDETETHSGPSMARRISFKFALAGSPPMNGSDFIDRYCTRSSTHGTLYQVKAAAGGESREMAGWLREKLKIAAPTPPPPR